MPNKYLRRLITLPAVLIVAPALTLLWPVVLLLAALRDLFVDRRRWPTTRIATLLVLAFWLEFTGTIIAGLTWLLTLGGLIEKPYMAVSYWTVRWWTTGLLGAASLTVGLRMEVEGFGGALRKGPLLALGRHTSIADAAVPVWFLANTAHRDLRYILTMGLQWGPCFDLVGNRVLAHFVDRSGKRTSAEVAAIEAIGAAETDYSFVGLFPEGRFRTDETFARSIDKITEVDPARGTRMGQLRHLMPPLPGGFLGVMRGSINADVMIIGHLGFENFSSNRRIYENIPFREPCHIKMWRFSRAEIPDDEVGRLAWLDDVWIALDHWIEQVGAQQ